MSNQIAGFICLLIGAAAGVFFVYTLMRAKQLSKWIVTQGTVLESKLRPVGYDSFEPFVVFEYKVRGTHYRHDTNKKFNYIYEYEDQAIKKLKPYQIGKSVKVYFDPQNPQDSVLEKRDAIWLYFFWAIFSFFFIFCGITFLLNQ
jgi:Protein of unknown function (DUF3592)